MRLLPGVATPGHEIYFKAAAVRNSSNLKADPGSLKQYQLLLGRCDRLKSTAITTSPLFLVGQT